MTTTAEPHVRILRGALDAMRQRGPQNLGPALELTSHWEAAADRISDVDQLLNLLKQTDTNDPLRAALHQVLAGWDFAQAPTWATRQTPTHVTDGIRLPAHGHRTGSHAMVGRQLPLVPEPW